MRRVVCLAVVLMLQTAPPVAAVTMRLTVDGETAFFAPPGDTVAVEITIDSEGEALTGVELFLAFDPRLFDAVDLDPAPGVQPVRSDSLLGDVLADTLLAVSDSLSLVHFAEADLGGREANGRAARAFLAIVDWHSGVSDVGVHQDPAAFRVSAYTVSNIDGTTQLLNDVTPVRFEDLAPALDLPAALVVEEDGLLRVRLDTFAQDEVAESLTWSAISISGDSSMAVSLDAGADSVVAIFDPSPDFSGTSPVKITVTDPGGGAASREVSIQVLPVNDPPRFSGNATLSVTLGRFEASRLLALPQIVDVDDEAGSLVWDTVAAGVVGVSIQADGVLIQAPVDWAGEETVAVRVADPKGLFDTVEITVSRPAGSGLTGDFDDDGRVDFDDFLLFAGAFGKADADSKFDLTHDGQVRFDDFLAFVEHFGESVN